VRETVPWSFTGARRRMSQPPGLPAATEYPYPECQRQQDTHNREADEHRRWDRLSALIPRAHMEMMTDRLVRVIQPLLQSMAFPQRQQCDVRPTDAPRTPLA
jgi:hypothetical protein